MRFILLAGVLAAPAPQLTPDPFVARRDAAAAHNTRSPNFTIATEESRRTFRIGERIPLIFTYDDVPNRRHLEGREYTDFATAVLDHTDGTADPSADFERADLYLGPGVCCGVEGAVLGPSYVDAEGKLAYLPPPKPPAVHLHVFLDDGVRFDVPGRYRLYMEDGHDGEAPIVSNIIEIEITARDSRRDAEAIAAAARVLDTSADENVRIAAVRSLAVAGSGAIDEIARRVWRPARTWREALDLESALFAVADRSRAIAAVDARVDDPAQPISMRDLRTLAALRLTREHPEGFRAADKRSALIAAETRRLSVLKRAGTLVHHLAVTFRDVAKADDPRGLPGPAGLVLTTRAITGFPDEVAAALDRLTPAARELVVDRLDDALNDPRLAPLFERQARAGSGASVRLLNRLAPERARPIIRDDLVSRHPRFPLDVADLLPVESVSGIDAPLLMQLHASRNRRELVSSLARIARYATPAILPDVMTAYRSQPAASSCEIAAPALAYFFRADPGSAKAIFAAIRRAPVMPRDQCEDEWPAGLLKRTAAHGWSAGLERYALELAGGDDPALVAIAAETLSLYGDTAGKAPLLDALDAWRARWTPARAAQLETSEAWESTLESRLMWAIHDGRAWELQPDDLARLRAGCRFSRCSSDVDEFERRMPEAGEEPSMSVHYDPGTHAPAYVLHLVRFTAEQLDRRLDAFPPGTAFRWTDDLEDPFRAWYLDVDEPFDRARAMLMRQGLTLHRNTRGG